MYHRRIFEWRPLSPVSLWLVLAYHVVNTIHPTSGETKDKCNYQQSQPQLDSNEESNQIVEIAADLG